jgi:hypothetical protein
MNIIVESPRSVTRGAGPEAAAATGDDVAPGASTKSEANRHTTAASRARVRERRMVGNAVGKLGRAEGDVPGTPPCTHIRYETYVTSATFEM